MVKSSVCVTGTFPENRAIMKRYLGRRLRDSVTEATGVLLVGARPGKVKLRDARRRGVNILVGEAAMRWLRRAARKPASRKPAARSTSRKPASRKPAARSTSRKPASRKHRRP